VEGNGVPVVPGSAGAVESSSDARSIADQVGYPVLIKAAGGGGGRGMQVVKSAAEIETAYTMARTEASASFRNDTVYIEKYLEKPRHIEVQVFADGQGGAVHLGERDCSLQRRHQKVLEEARSPALNDQQREKIGTIAADAVRRIGYSNAGTIEFLFEDGEFYFIEMNTRLQVEHPVTEMITGIDMVREQIRVAAGSPLSFTQADVTFSGHAIECRIMAENPETFIPSPGRITDYHPPGGMSVRVDSGLYAGYDVPPYYDSLVSKLIVHGRNRNECLMRLRRSLEEYVIDGIETTIPLHAKIIENSDFINGDYDIHWLERFVAGDVADD
jgi:acetyl-CoA carboxylase biotin carboxylase subunit